VRQAAEDRGVDLQFDHPEAGFVVLADASKMERVLVNLARNAVEAIAKGEEADHHEVSVSARADGSDAIFHVQDDGPGIPQDAQDHLFVPFATVGKRGGTGLGLPIVKQFVQAHNGTIDMRTSEEGTHFTIRLPNRVRPRATAETVG
jgi:signal transduction histidine kinase